MANKTITFTVIVAVALVLINAISGGFISDEITERLSNEAFKESVMCGLGGSLYLPVTEQNIFGRLVKIPYPNVFQIVLIFLISALIIFLFRMLGLFNLLELIFVPLFIFLLLKTSGYLLVKGAGQGCIDIIFNYNQIAGIGVIGFIIPVAIGLGYLVNRGR